MVPEKLISSYLGKFIQNVILQGMLRGRVLMYHYVTTLDVQTELWSTEPLLCSGKHLGVRESIFKTVTEYPVAHEHGKEAHYFSWPAGTCAVVRSQGWITATHTCDVPILWVLLGFTFSVFCLVGGMVWFTNASWVAPREETLTLALRMLLRSHRGDSTDLVDFGWDVRTCLFEPGDWAVTETAYHSHQCVEVL